MKSADPYSVRDLAPNMGRPKFLRTLLDLRFQELRWARLGP
jgi:hypothetical protein